MNLKTKFAVLISLIIVNAYAANASADCYVHLSKQCAANSSDYLSPGRYFRDTEIQATISASRCLERAQEYKNYCRTPGLESIAVFNLNGRNIIGSATDATNRSHVFDPNIWKFNGFSK